MVPHRLHFLVLPALALSVAIAEEPSSSPYDVGESIPLEQSDLQEIERQVLAANPILSSSPGIKYAGAQRSFRSHDVASIIWYPHLNSAGVEEALQVSCRRNDQDRSWSCNPAKIRRYLKVERQEFAVRLLDNTRPDVGLALVEATREAARAEAANSSTVADAAILVFPYEDGYLVTWGTREGYQEVCLQARLRDGGDPARPGDWGVNLYVPDLPETPEKDSIER